MMKTQRNYKSSVFIMLFSEPEKLLRLYNAVNGTHYTNDEDLQITTLENAIYTNMKNDVSFVFDAQLSLYEHQSTVNPNMPLRDFLYLSRVLQRLVADENLFGGRLIQIPTPRFVVFYNGRRRQPLRRVISLSDAFLTPVAEPELELKVTVININSECGDRILQECRELWEYSQFIEKVRGLAENMPVDKAVEAAVDVCIQEGILADFLTKNKAEAIAMSIFEFDQEKYDAALREEGYDRGRAEGHQAGLEEGHQAGLEEGHRVGLEEGHKAGLAEGKAENIISLLGDLGEVPEEVSGSVYAQKETAVLDKWLKYAARAQSMEAFVEKCGL